MARAGSLTMLKLLRRRFYCLRLPFQKAVRQAEMRKAKAIFVKAIL